MNIGLISDTHIPEAMPELPAQIRQVFADTELILHVPKYLNSPETPIFHKGRLLYGLALAKAALRQREKALIVEGYTDVIACHRQGVTHAVGTLGTALTEHHVGLLKGIVKEVVLVFDGDAAGGAATERSIGLFLDAGMIGVVKKLEIWAPQRWEGYAASETPHFDTHAGHCAAATGSRAPRAG